MQQKKIVIKRNPTLLTRQHASREKRMQHPGMRERTSRTPCFHLARDGHILLGRLDQRVDYRHVGRAVRSPAPHGLREGRWSSYSVLQFHYSYMSRTPWRSRALRSAVTFDLVHRNVALSHSREESGRQAGGRAPKQSMLNRVEDRIEVELLAGSRHYAKQRPRLLLVSKSRLRLHRQEHTQKTEPSPRVYLVSKVGVHFGRLKLCVWQWTCRL